MVPAFTKLISTWTFKKKKKYDSITICLHHRTWREERVARRVNQKFFLPNHLKTTLQNYLLKLSTTYKTSNNAKIVPTSSHYIKFLAGILASKPYFSVKQWLYLCFGIIRNLLAASVTQNSCFMGAVEVAILVGKDHILGS